MALNVQHQLALDLTAGPPSASCKFNGQTQHMAHSLDGEGKVSRTALADSDEEASFVFIQQ